jgi:hypothetical protein
MNTENRAVLQDWKRKYAKRQITVREIGDGFYLATFCVRDGVRSGLGRTPEEAISRVNLSYTEKEKRTYEY